jgi:hypothetical protein
MMTNLGVAILGLLTSLAALFLAPSRAEARTGRLCLSAEEVEQRLADASTEGGCEWSGCTYQCGFVTCTDNCMHSCDSWSCGGSCVEVGCELPT